MMMLACCLSLIAAKAREPAKTPGHHAGRPHPLTPKALRASEDLLNRDLKDRKGPWTEARAKALSLDDRARVLQDKGRLFKDRAGLSAARHSTSPGGFTSTKVLARWYKRTNTDVRTSAVLCARLRLVIPDKAAMEAFDRAQLISDRSRLLEDKSHLFSDRAKILAGKESEEEHLEPDVPRSEQANVQNDRESMLKTRSRMMEDKALLLRDSGHLVADYGEHVTGIKGMSRAMVSAVAEDKGLLHQVTKN